MTLYDLRGKEMYVGSRKIGKAYFNNGIIFGKPALVFPKPPPTTISGAYQYFYGGGEVVNHGGNTYIPSGIDSSIMKPNGLHPTGSIVVFAGDWNTSWDLVITIENPRANSVFRNNPAFNNILTSSSYGVNIAVTSANKLRIQSSLTSASVLVDLPPETTKSITIHITQDRNIRSGRYYYFHTASVENKIVLDTTETTGSNVNKYVTNFTLHNPDNRFVYYATSYRNPSGLSKAASELNMMNDEFVLTDQL